MSAIADFFARNFVGVYFFYGLSFFSMGLAIFVEISHSSESEFARALRPLAGFGIVHGSHEWFEMFLLINPHFAEDPSHYWIPTLRVILMAASFLMLVAFGVRLITGGQNPRVQLLIMTIVTGIWLVGLIGVLVAQPTAPSQMVAADVYTRYALAIPGAALAAWGLLLQRRSFIQQGMQSFGRDVAIAALAFGLYGGIGQLFASPSTIFPSSYLNANVFVLWFGFPIQVFRATMATLAAISIIRSLRSFEVDNRRRIEALQEAQMEERRRLESIRAEFLHRTVKAQESERQRIARELHDETGQTLTALGMGLRGLSESISNNPSKAVQQAERLENLAVTGLDELKRLVTGLHPPQLDDLGLIAGIRWYAGEISKHYNLPITISSHGDNLDIPLDMRVVFFRITQEAITNAIRHAQASKISIILDINNQEVTMKIQDNGKGFNVNETLSREASRSSWGLLGMKERANLIGGDCIITSNPGQGACVEVHAQWEKPVYDQHTPAAG